jgi:hypothetical protein
VDRSLGVRMLERLDTYSFALGVGEECPAGNFVLDLATGRFEWSEGLYRIHGYSPGEVVPTLDLLMAHKHPEDRPAIRNLIASLRSNGGQGALFHRLFDSHGVEHRVFTAAEGIRDGSGEVVAIHGFTVDLTASVAAEASRAAADAVRGAYATKAIIEQAKGLIMGLMAVDAEAAFGVLCARSQNTNTKLAAVATALVDAATQGQLPQALRTWGIRVVSVNRATPAAPPVLKSGPRDQG